MNNVVALRKNQPYLVGDQVYLGDSKYIFTVKGLGLCVPKSHSFMELKGKLVNGSEFVQLGVPGSNSGVIDVHKSFISKVQGT
jgi:hypothetical protein